MEHPSREVLLRFILGAASRPESRLVVRHLLARCPACAASLQQLRREPPLSPAPSPEAYDPAFDRAEALIWRLTQKPDPPPPLALAAAAGEGRRPGSGTTGRAARRRWLFG